MPSTSALLAALDFSENLPNSLLGEPLSLPVTLHREGFPRACLPIGKDSAVIALR